MTFGDWCFIISWTVGIIIIAIGTLLTILVE